MNSYTWIGIITWGMTVTLFGLLSAAPVPGSVSGMQAQDLVFLIAGGLVTIVLGSVGLLNFKGWLPGLHQVQKSPI